MEFWIDPKAKFMIKWVIIENLDVKILLISKFKLINERKTKEFKKGMPKKKWEIQKHRVGIWWWVILLIWEKNVSFLPLQFILYMNSTKVEQKRYAHADTHSYKHLLQRIEQRPKKENNDMFLRNRMRTVERAQKCVCMCREKQREIKWFSKRIWASEVNEQIYYMFTNNAYGYVTREWKSNVSFGFFGDHSLSSARWMNIWLCYGYFSSWEPSSLSLFDFFECIHWQQIQ